MFNEIAVGCVLIPSDNPHDALTHFRLSPTHNEDERIDRLRLIRSSRIGPVTFYRLMLHYKKASSVFDHLPDIARKAGIRDYVPCSRAAAQKEWETGQKLGARPLFINENGYPSALANVRDAPPFIWLKGDIQILDKPAIALVGSRNASSLGSRMARILTRDLADAGFITVSGFARGIDTAVHTASLDSGTVAVFAGGISVVYPKENADLARKIDQCGVIISEQPVSMYPQGAHFPRRNRIISGLAQAVIVVEASTRSGSLLTAQFALDQGRDVFAVPGSPLDARAAGCNNLICQGATLIRSAQDVLKAVHKPTVATSPADHPVARSDAQGVTDKECGKTRKNPDTERADNARAQSSSQVCEQSGEQDVKQAILSLLGPVPITENQLIRDLKIKTEKVSSALLMLEMERKIKRHPGGLVSIAV